MRIRWLLGGLLPAVCVGFVAGCVESAIDRPEADGAMLMVEGNVLDRLTARGARQAEVQVTVHVGETRLTGRASAMAGGHFIVRATGPAVAGPVEPTAVDLVARGRGYDELTQTIPGYMIVRDGAVLILPDVRMDRSMPW